MSNNVQTDSGFAPRRLESITTTEILGSTRSEMHVPLAREPAQNFVKVSRVDWDLLIAKVQKSDKQQVASFKVLTDLAKQNKFLRRQVTEYKEAYLRSEGNYADLLRAQGFTSSVRNRLTRSLPGQFKPKHASVIPADLSCTLLHEKSSSNDTELLTSGKVQNIVNNRDSSAGLMHAEQAQLPKINEMLKNSAQPESWYTSWKITPNMPQIGVSVSTFQSLAQEFAHLQCQMNKVSAQAGYDVKTNLELQESLRLLQNLLAEKDAVIQQFKKKVSTADAIIAKRGKLVEAHSLECARLLAAERKEENKTENLNPEHHSPDVKIDAHESATTEISENVKDASDKITLSPTSLSPSNASEACINNVSTSSQSFSKWPQEFNNFDSSSLTVFTASSTPRARLAGVDFMCENCDVLFDNKQKFDEHCVKCISD